MFPREFSFCFYISYAHMCTCRRQNLRETFPWSNITWSEMGKQNVQAEEVHFSRVCPPTKMASETVRRSIAFVLNLQCSYLLIPCEHSLVISCYFLGSIVVSPRSFSGLSTCSGSEMQMRLQFEYTRDHKENGSKKCLEQEMQELRNKRHCICCRLCGSAIQSPER